MEKLILSKYDLNKFLWRDTGDDMLVRPFAGAELVQDLFNRYGKGEQMLFIAAYVDLSEPVSEKQLVDAGRDAWLWLRFHIPTIATLVAMDESNVPCLQYRPATATSITDWVNNTFVVTKQKQIDLHDLRHKLGQMKIPTAEGLQTWMHLVPGHVEAEGLVSNFALLLQSHHSPFDGTGVKIIMGRYLGQLCSSLNALVAHQLRWGEEAANLVPAALNILAPSVPLPIAAGSAEEPSISHPYYGTLAKVMTEIGESLKDPYGFRPRQGDPGWPSNSREEIVFTQDESDQIIKALKTASPADGNRFTVTHLGHTALGMVVVADNPPAQASKSQCMVNWHLSNCRFVLKEPYATRDGYPGYVLGVSSFLLPVSLYMTGDSPSPLTKATLLSAMNGVREIYEEKKAYPTQYAYMGQAAELVAMSMAEAVKSGHPPPPNNGYMFSSDGIGEKHLDHIYSDDSTKQCLTLTKFWTSVNHTDPGPFFRISSWRGAIDISADYNSNVISTADVREYLSEWKKYILMIAP